MKKIIRTGDLCCESCARRIAVKLESLDGVRSARANCKKQVILIETEENFLDETVAKFLRDAGVEVKSIEMRKGLFY